MENYSKTEILNSFVAGEYEQIFCDKCMNTFATNVYDFDEGHVILEKRALGLEYFCNAIHQFGLSSFPDVMRIGVLDEDDQIITLPPEGELFQKKETDYRYLYLMEKLQHLDEEDAQVFNEYTKDLDWKDEAERVRALKKVEEHYGAGLTREIELLFAYYQKYKEYILWDLHGDNLMRRPVTEELVILDPFAINS